MMESLIYKIDSKTKYHEINFDNIKSDLDSLNFDFNTVYETILILGQSKQREVNRHRV